MIILHLAIGMLTGTIAAAVLWHFDYPFWLMLVSYSLAGSSGLLASALFGLAVQWLADKGLDEECDPSVPRSGIGALLPPPGMRELKS